jgi:hypothetical protein
MHRFKRQPFAKWFPNGSEYGIRTSHRPGEGRAAPRPPGLQDEGSHRLDPPFEVAQAVRTRLLQRIDRDRNIGVLLELAGFGEDVGLGAFVVRGGEGAGG